MATQWGQTGLRHKDINIQREFERKSSPVIQDKTQSSVSSNTPTNNSLQSSDNQYTVYHNGSPVNEIKTNIGTNYIDSTNIINGDRYDIIFETFSTGNDANVKAFVNIPKTQITSQAIYTEEFYTDRYFSDEPHALASDLIPNYMKFGTIVYHDVKHNFGVDNKYELLWSITYIGECSYRCIPLVVPIDNNTIRVYSSVRYGLSKWWEYRNTSLMNIPEEEIIAKESLPKFYIAVYTSKDIIIKLILHGGYANTIDYNSIIHGGFANTITYNSTINGGKA